MKLRSDIISTTPGTPTLTTYASPTKLGPLPPEVKTPRWNFTRPRTDISLQAVLDGDTRIDVNASLNAGSELCHTSAAASHQLLCYASDRLQASLSSMPKALEWLAVGEEDVHRKLSIQRRFYDGWHIEPEADFGEPTREFVSLLSIVAKQWYASFRSAGAGISDPVAAAHADLSPVDTMGGWPTFSTDYSLHVASCQALDLSGAPSAAQFLAAGSALARGLDLPDHPFAAGLSRRSGPTQKAQVLYSAAHSGLNAIGEAKGVWTRGRNVYPGSRLLLHFTSPLYLQLATARSKRPGMWHDARAIEWQKSYIAQKLSSGWSLGEGDFSGYDTSISPALRKAAWAALKAAGFDTRVLDGLLALEERMVVYAPRYSGATPGVASVRSPNHGLLSGEKNTSNLGSFITEAITLKYKMRRYGWALSSLEKREVHPSLILSDDTFLIEPKPIDEDMYIALAAEEGLKIKINSGRRMLMTHQDGLSTYAVAARVVQQTLWNEDRLLHLGQAVLGLASRLERGVHPSLWPVTRDILSKMTGPLGEIFSRAASSASQGAIPMALMQHPSVHKFLMSAEGQAYAQRLFLSLSYRPSLMAQARLLERVGLTAGASAQKVHSAAVDAFYRPKSRTQILESLRILNHYTANL